MKCGMAVTRNYAFLGLPLKEFHYKGIFGTKGVKKAAISNPDEFERTEEH
jgi:hypothetical protein